MPARLIAAAIATFWLISGFSMASAQQRNLAPRITTTVWLQNAPGLTGSLSYDDIQDYLDFSVGTLAMTSDGAPRLRHVSSCQLWRQALHDGYERFEDRFSIEWEAAYERVCLPLLLMLKARPATASYLPAPDAWTSTPLEFTSAARQRLPRWPWRNETRSVSEDNPDPPFEPAGADPRVGPFGAVSTELDEPMSDGTPYGWESTWWDAARGDFNDDGVEDVLVLFLSAGIGHRGLSSDSLILTRRGPDSPVEIIMSEHQILAMVSATS